MRTTLSLAISATLLALSTSASADAQIDPVLQQKLTAIGPHQVVVTFSDRSQMDRLLTVSPTAKLLSELPMAGALLTSLQVQQVAAWPGVESIYFNAPLNYTNHEAAEITGGHYVHDNIGLKGHGVTVAVLDSGIDARHADLSFGTKTVQNVKIVGDLGLMGNTLYAENQPNTDTSSGHGTHVAGTVGGTGAASASDTRRAYYYDGIAPEASLIGLGTGEGLSILFAIEGFDWVLANQDRYGIDIVTNSWGSSNSVYDPNNPINQASYEAYRRGIVVSFAAGNDGPDADTLNPYAIVPWVINVGSGTKARDLSDFSSRGLEGDFYKHIDVVAPGSNICSTRAIGTAVGALGPVVNASYPTYTANYHCISGTSMATPFVAGVSALLLEANPQLSPDQIEQILMQTADPIAGYSYQDIGGGYINVARAVDIASQTEGKRVAFLGGATAWSSQGQWNKVSDSQPLLAYSGTWRSASSAGASDGSYRYATVSKREVPRLRMAFSGEAFQIEYPRDNRGGLADVYVDGINRGRISFFSASADRGTFAVASLAQGLHHVELRGVKDRVYFDGALVDGPLFASNTTLSSQTTTFTGTMGPSVENLEIDSYPIEITSDAISITAKLGWSGGVDLDLYLLDPQGNQVASGATLANPETLEFAVSQPGTYTLQATGYATIIATYTLDATVTRAVTTSP